MNSSNCVSTFMDPKNRPYVFSMFIAISLFCGAFVIGNALFEKVHKERISKWQMQMIGTMHKSKSDACKNWSRPQGSEGLPEGIIVKTSDLQMQPLWGSLAINTVKPSVSLLGMAVGIKQKEIVNEIITKFLSSEFVVMLFHYDGVVDEWRDLDWNDHVIHISAKNQTKWWFAKRFLHPDIVTKYDYIFLWDEDIAVENFHPQRYIDIIRDEGLEISQPALDPAKSIVHHPITARKKDSSVHRRCYKLKGSGMCDDNSTNPPCTGWVEMMAPVFSNSAWRCVWYMIQVSKIMNLWEILSLQKMFCAVYIYGSLFLFHALQNDLIHAWGLDRQLGYCAQGDRTKNVGVVDSEYVVHLGLPTLGVTKRNKVAAESSRFDNRPAVRRKSYVEMQIFKQRWREAVRKDKCWID